MITLEKDELCSCGQRATLKLNGYAWMCKKHFNKLVKHIRIQRKLNSNTVVSVFNINTL